MRIRIEADVDVPDREVIEAIEEQLAFKSREDLAQNIEGAEFKIDIEGITYRFNVTEAALED